MAAMTDQIKFRKVYVSTVAHHEPLDEAALQAAVNACLAKLPDLLNTVYAQPTTPAPTANAEMLRRQMEYFTPSRLIIKGEEFDVYGYDVHTGGYIPEGVTVCVQKSDPSLRVPLGGSMIIFDEKAGTVTGREEDLEHFFAHVAPAPKTEPQRV